MNPEQSKPNELVYDFVLVPWTEDPEYGYYSRQLAIFEANKFYGRGSDPKSIGGWGGAHPNHGLTHGVRQAYLAMDLIKHLATDPDKYGALGHWAEQLLKDEKRSEILFLMALHFRGGRLVENENDFREDVAHIKKVLKNSQLLTHPEDIENLADLFRRPPQLHSDEKKFMALVLDVAHHNDALRLENLKLSESENEQKHAIGTQGSQSAENQNSIIQFMQKRAKIYHDATGVFNLKYPPAQVHREQGYVFSNPEIFGWLENTPKELYSVMEAASEK